MKTGDVVKFRVLKKDFDAAVKSKNPAGIRECLFAQALRRQFDSSATLGWISVQIKDYSQGFALDSKATEMMQNFCDEDTRAMVRAKLPATFTMTCSYA